MPAIRPLSPLEAGILIYLSGEALHGRGWLRGGVRGWRLYSEIRDAQQDAYIAERLPHMARLGLLDRLALPEFGRKRATLLYRISQEGERRLAGVEGRPCEALPCPAAEDRGGNALVPAATWTALATLQRCARERIGPVRFGAHGWMSAGEVGAGQASLRHDDLVWLVRRRMAEMRKAPGAQEGSTTATLYRLTGPALRAEAVDAVTSPGGRVELVEARVPGPVGPAAAPRRRLAPGSGSRRPSGAAAVGGHGRSGSRGRNCPPSRHGTQNTRTPLGDDDVEQRTLEQVRREEGIRRLLRRELLHLPQRLLAPLVGIDRNSLRKFLALSRPEPATWRRLREWADDRPPAEPPPGMVALALLAGEFPAPKRPWARRRLAGALHELYVELDRQPPPWLAEELSSLKDEPPGQAT